MKKNTLNKIYLLFGSLLLTFILIEILLILFLPQPTIQNLKGMLGKYYISSNFNTFELKKNYSGTEPSQERPKERVSINTNKQGLRKTYKAKDSKDTILILGDSYTFGVYVNDFDTYPSILSKLLEEEGNPYNVINAGYASGFQTDQQYAWLNRYYINENLCPKFVILGFFAGNDLDGIKESYWKHKDEYGMPLSVIDNNLIVTENGYLRNKKRSSITIGSEFFYKIPIINNLHSFVLAGRVIDKILNIILKRGGRGYDLDTFSHYFGDYNKKFYEREKKFLEIVDFMKLKLDRCGSSFIIVNIPINFEIEPNFLNIIPNYTEIKNKKTVYHERIEKLITKKNIHFINITKSMLKDYNLNKDVNFFPENSEVHLNENGYYYVGKKIKEYILKNF